MVPAIPTPASGGTAIPDEDYTPVSGSLTFTPGVTSQVFSVPILHDNLHEGNETVGLSLHSVSGAGLGLEFVVEVEELQAEQFGEATPDRGFAGTRLPQDKERAT